MQIFDHEKLTVYKLSISLVANLDKIAKNLPKGRAYLSDQLLRAVTSISLNIAEGAGESLSKRKKDFIEWRNDQPQNVLR